MDGLEELPPGWAWARLGEILPVPRPKLAADANSDLPFVGLEHIPANGLKPSGFGRFATMRSAASQFQPGDVLYGRLRPYLNKVWCADRIGAASAEFIVFPNSSQIDGQFLALLLHHSRFVTFAMHVVSGDRPRIDVSDMAPYMVGLPPLTEQKRIVAEVENLFSELDEAEAALGRAREALTDYRASLLHAACTGRLTESWRAANSQPVEDGPALLRRILAERRATWERAELARLAAKGKPAPKGDAWKSRYKQPRPPDTDNLVGLPDRWTWASLDQLSTLITSGSRAWAPYYDRGSCVFVMAQNIRPRRFDRSFVQLVDPPPNDPERGRTQICCDDLLVTIVGANTGNVCRVDVPVKDHFVCQSVALVRPVCLRLSSYVEAFLCAEQGGQATFRTMMYGAGRPHLSFEQLRSIAMPLPPEAEITECLSALQAIAEETVGADGMFDEIKLLSPTLRQSILHAAFTGRLVPQDPADEPASTLLARLHASPPTSRKPRRARSSQDALL